MKTIFGIEIKGLKEQIKPEIKEEETLGVGAVMLENPVMELVKEKVKNLVNKKD